MVRRVVGVLGVLVMTALVPSAAVAIGPGVTTANFLCTGAEESWVAPPGVTSVDVVAIGARGGGSSGRAGGLGAVRSGTLAVTPGQSLWVEVGCAGASAAASGVGAAGGFNGGATGGGAPGSGGITGQPGAGGGGASDVRTVSRLAAGSLDSRLLVAAGGGGAGGGCGSGSGGAGGPGDAAGSASVNGRPGGDAGTLTAGGLAGGETAGGLPGGILGLGGAGLAGSPFEGGGGGGGGYYGGGGGAGNTSGTCSTGGGGGGGGSSFVAPQVTNPGSSGGAPADPPRISLTYRAVNPSAPGASFGTQALGTIGAPQTITLLAATPSGVSLAAGGLAFEGNNPEDFLLSYTDCTPSAGASCRLVFRFAPSASGPRTAKLRVTTVFGEFTIDLSGTGGAFVQGPAGATGATGAAGPAGPQGLPGPAGPAGQLVLVAYQATARASSATVRYALTGAADVTLKVKPSKGAAATVAKGKGKAGINQLSWNRKLGGKKAPKGTYKLTITATAGGKSVSSTVTLKLK